jgi:copper chaperone CopZ
LTKTFVINIDNLKTAEDATKIEDYFMSLPGVEKVKIEMSLNIVSLSYNEGIGSPNKLLLAFEKLGYPVR